MLCYWRNKLLQHCNTTGWLLLKLESNRSSPVLQQILQISPLLTECGQYTSGSGHSLSGHLVRKLLESHGVCSSQTKHQFFGQERGSFWISPGFSVFQYRLFWELTFPGKEKQASSKNNTKCGSTYASCTDLRIWLQKRILAVGSCSFKARAATALQGHSCNNFVVLRTDVFGTRSWAEKYSATLAHRLIL